MRLLRLLLAAALLPAPVGAALAASNRCVDEEAVADLPSGTPQAAPPSAPPSADSTDPRGQLAAMVRDALARSRSIGAARLLADAARDDIREASAGKDIQASINGGLGPSVVQSGDVRDTQALQLHAGITVSQLLYDGGRIDKLIDWRKLLADSARLGELSQQEQVSLTTVSLALERSRYRHQAVIYGQYQRKMACLVEALEAIVKSDRGRASELVQARKSLQQAELSLTQSQSQVRQVEVRLRRLVGDGLPPVDGLSSVLLSVPPLADLQEEAAQATEIAQLQAQADAAGRYAEATAASSKPQLSWSFGGSAAGGARNSVNSPRTGNMSLGLNISIPLTNGGTDAAASSARKRAMAAAMQRDDALDARRYRLAEVYEQSQSSFDRLRRVANVLRDSDQLRNFTLQQWQQLGRRSLFDVMAAESDHYALRAAYINALHDGQQTNAMLLSLGRGIGEWLH